jgi:hypothetical protein
MAQSTPEESLFVLRHAMTHVLEVADGSLRLQRVPFRLFYSLSALGLREIAQNAYFNPLSALEFRPEFDRIASVEVLSLIDQVPGAHAHRLVALTFLSLFRMLRYVGLVEVIAREAGRDRRRPGAGSVFLVLAVLRSDARALSTYLRQRAGALLAGSFEQDLLATPAHQIRIEYDGLVAEGYRLMDIKSALEGIAANLRLEMRRAFEHDLPSPDAGLTDSELRKRLIGAMGELRPALENAVLFFAKALGSGPSAPEVFDTALARREIGERLRRDVWMFAQIVRAFASKAEHAKMTDDRWAGTASLGFVREFLTYFRAMGYPLLRVNDYPRVDQFMGAMNALEEVDQLDAARMELAVREARAFHEFLNGLFDKISRRDELVGHPFDRKRAAAALKMYLGD